MDRLSNASSRKSVFGIFCLKLLFRSCEKIPNTLQAALCKPRRKKIAVELASNGQNLKPNENNPPIIVKPIIKPTMTGKDNMYF